MTTFTLLRKNHHVNLPERWRIAPACPVQSNYDKVDNMQMNLSRTFGTLSVITLSALSGAVSATTVSQPFSSSGNPASGITINTPARNAATVDLKDVAFNWAGPAVKPGNIIVRYDLVYSTEAGFNGFSEANRSCNDTCVYVAVSPRKARANDPFIKRNLGKATTYYWKVRAVVKDGQREVAGQWQASVFQTGTEFQRRVVLAANRAVGGAAPQSVMPQRDQSIPEHKRDQWDTDLYNGDGLRMLTALRRLPVARNGVVTVNGRAVALRTQMVADLRPYYIDNTATALVDHMIARYQANPRLPTIADGTLLTYLQIRQQCKEFVDTLVKNAQGTQRCTCYDGVANDRIRPGMYATTGGRGHTALVTAIHWTGNQVTEVTVVESNFGNSWSNPPGQRPWQRTITTRKIPVTTFTRYISAE